MSPAAFMAVDLAISWKLPSPLLYVFSLQGLGGVTVPRHKWRWRRWIWAFWTDMFGPLPLLFEQGWQFGPRGLLV